MIIIIIIIIITIYSFVYLFWQQCLCLSKLELYRVTLFDNDIFTFTYDYLKRMVASYFMHRNIGWCFHWVTLIIGSSFCFLFFSNHVSKMISLCPRIFRSYIGSHPTVKTGMNIFSKYLKLGNLFIYLFLGKIILTINETRIFKYLVWHLRQFSKTQSPRDCFVDVYIGLLAFVQSFFTRGQSYTRYYLNPSARKLSLKTEHVKNWFDLKFPKSFQIQQT